MFQRLSKKYVDHKEAILEHLHENIQTLVLYKNIYIIWNESFSRLKTEIKELPTKEGLRIILNERLSKCADRTDDIAKMFLTLMLCYE